MLDTSAQDECEEDAVTIVQEDTSRTAAAVDLSANSGSVQVSRQYLVAMRKYYNAVKEAYFTFSQTDGDSEQAVRRLFELTLEVLAAASPAGGAPLGLSIARRHRRATAGLLDLAEARNPRVIRHRTPAGEDALMLAIDADADEAVIRRLVRLLADGGFGPGRNALHAASDAASAGRPRALEVVLDELRRLLDECTSEALRDRLADGLNAGDSDGCSPLLRMARGNQTAALQTVLDLARRHGLRLNWDSRQASGRGLTPLVAAAEAGALEACDFLLSQRLASVDLDDRRQRNLWLCAAPSASTRRLLGRQSRQLLEPLSDVPDSVRQRLLDGLRERHLERVFVDRLSAHCPCMPRPLDVSTCLARLETFSGVARLLVWDALQGLDEAELAQLLEGPREQP